MIDGYIQDAFFTGFLFGCLIGCILMAWVLKGVINKNENSN